MDARIPDAATRATAAHRAPFELVLELSRIDEPQDPHAFRFEPQGYTLRTAGGGRERFDIDWSGELLADLAAIREPGRDPARVQRVGELLRRALKSAGWDGLGQQIHAAHEIGRPVVVTLRSNAAELYALPWELVTVGPSGQHLGELFGVLLRQEWPATATAAEDPCPRPEGGRILLAWSAAGGGVPAAEHLRAIAAACSKGHVVFDPGRDVLANASAAGVADALAEAEARGQPFAALHLLCHGGRTGSTFGLVLDGDDAAAGIVDAGRLRQLLAPHARTLRLVVLAACDGGNNGDPGNHLGSAAQALHRAGIQSVVASRYPLSVAGSVVLTEALYRSLLVGLDSLERAFTAARARLARDPQQLDWASVQLYTREADGDDTRPLVFRPYRGLLSFEAEHRRFFFGRDAERREVLGDLQALIDGGKPRFIVVAGASGTGKSSMVLSGVVPDVDQLKADRPGPWEVAVLRPGDRPLIALSTALAGRTDAQRPLLLVVDQFEELFTYGEDPTAREAFVRRLWALARADTGVHCIITIRVDFLARCGEIALDESGVRLDRIAYDEAHRVFVARMGPEQVRAAIEGPAARSGLALAPGLTDQILADVGNEPGALPLLQYALDRLWLRRVGRTLSIEVYAELGGLVGALQTKADGLIDGLAEGPRRHARRLLTRLVGIGDDEGVDTRRRVELAQLLPSEESARAVFQDVLERLVDARLVVRNEEHGAPALEIAHEALIRRWTRLRGWLAEDRSKLSELENFKEWLGQWERHGALLSGAQLGYAIEIVRRHSDDVEDRMRELVRASAARERLLRNVSRAINTLMALGIFALTGLSYYALQQTNLANERLAAAKRASNEILTEVLPRYETIPGTAEVRREIHGRLEALQQTLRTGAQDDAELLHMEIMENIKRGELAMTHERMDQAHAEFTEALEIAERLAGEHPEDTLARLDLAASLGKLGNVERLAGDRTASRSHLERSFEVAETLAEADPNDPRAMRLLSDVLGFMGLLELEEGDISTARSRCGRSLQVREGLVASDPSRPEDQLELATGLRCLGAAELWAGRLETARTHFERSRQVAEAQVQAHPSNVRARRSLILSLSLLGDVDKDAGDLASARVHYERSLQIREALAKADPEGKQTRRDLSTALERVGDLEMNAGDLAAARAYYERSLQIREALAKADPSSRELQRDLLSTKYRVGEVDMWTGDLASARVHMTRVLQAAEALVKADPSSDEDRRGLAAALTSLAELDYRGGDLAVARTSLERSLQIREVLAQADATSAEAQLELVPCLGLLGRVEQASGNFAAARVHFDRALRITETQARNNPTSAAAQRALWTALGDLGALELQTGDLAGARPRFERALQLAGVLDPSDTEDQRRLSTVLDRFGELEVQAGDLAAAHAHLDRSLRIREALARDAPHDGQATFDLVEAHLRLADLARREARADATRSHLEAARTALDGMSARGQIDGFAPREQADERVRRELGRSNRSRGPERGGVPSPR